MDISKVKSAIANVKSEILNASREARKVVADEKSDMDAVNVASKTLKALGTINTAMGRVEGKMESALKKLEPKAKKAKKDKAADKK